MSVLPMMYMCEVWIFLCLLLDDMFMSGIILDMPLEIMFHPVLDKGVSSIDMFFSVHVNDCSIELGF